MSFVNTLFGKKAKPHDLVEILDQKTFKEAISNKEVQLIDVRTRLEYNSGHIENAINIDFFDHANFNEAHSENSSSKAI